MMRLKEFILKTIQKIEIVITKGLINHNLTKITRMSLKPKMSIKMNLSDFVSILAK